MDKLKNYQAIFVENVIYHADNPNQDLLDLMIPIGKLSPKDVIGVYSTDYKFRMLETMQSNFESIWMVLGDDVFQELVFAFIKAHPSSEYDLNLFGKFFPDYLASQNSLIEEMPFLFELAKFEVLFWKIFHAPNPKVLNRQNFTNEQILNSQFIFDSSIELIRGNFSVFPLFKYKDKSLDEFFENHDAEIINQESFYLLYKEHDKVSCQILSQAQFSFFSQLNEKKSLIDVINQTQDITQEEIVDIFKIISTSFLQNLKEA